MFSSSPPIFPFPLLPLFTLHTIQFSPFTVLFFSLNFSFPLTPTLYTSYLPYTPLPLTTNFSPTTSHLQTPPFSDPISPFTPLLSQLRLGTFVAPGSSSIFPLDLSNEILLNSVDIADYTQFDENYRKTTKL